MAYPINEIFYSLQGEGFWSGRAAVFVRFSGCNLNCSFCDTDFHKNISMGVDEIVCGVNAFPSDFVILTGGEPSLFADSELMAALHSAGKFVAMETNGTHLAGGGSRGSAQADWVTLSPKDCFNDKARVVLKQADEVKLVFSGDNEEAFVHYSTFPAKHYFLQPLDTGNAEKNSSLLAKGIAYCREHPQWRISLQLHKIMNIR